MAKDDSNSFGWFLAGLGIGAAVGMLWAPKSGRETREAILRTAEESRDAVLNRARDAREQASQWVDRSKDFVQSQKDQFRSAYEAGRQAYKDVTSGGSGVSGQNL